tara:strand:+ start:399 stop:593 length:195 start_codon:yes stop_codon:yes gene_type:complete
LQVVGNINVIRVEVAILEVDSKSDFGLLLFVKIHGIEQVGAAISFKARVACFDSSGNKGSLLLV